MRCQQCERILSLGVRVGTKYCGAACRARAYRERVRGATQPSDAGDQSLSMARRAANMRPGRASSRPDQRRTADRIRPPAHRKRTGWRVAFDEQVLAQAPDDAMGYRVVLPCRDEWDAPRVVPDADVTGSPSFWRLRPFELPDDIRLRSGKLYRLLWVDAQGALVPPLGNRCLPALRFFLGSPDDQRVTKSVARRSEQAGRRKNRPEPTDRDPATHVDASEVPNDARRDEQTAPEPSADSFEQGHSAHDGALLEKAEAMVSPAQSATLDSGAQGSEVEVQPQASTIPPTAADPMPPPTWVMSDASPALSTPKEAPAPSTALASSGSATAPIPTATISTALEVEQRPNTASSEQRDDAPSSTPSKVTVQLGQKSIEVTEAAWAAAQAPLEAALAGASCIPNCSPPLAEAEIRELTGIILHCEKYAVFVHEVASFHARLFSKPVPPSPEFNVRPDEQDRIRAVACDPRLSRAAIDLYSAWLGCRMQGPDAMYHLPPPFVPLTDVEAGRITSILNSPTRRSYAAYAADRVDALQAGRPLPPQPTSDLNPKVRRHIRQLVNDARLLVLMQHGIWQREPAAAQTTEGGEQEVAGTAPTESG